MTIRNAWWEDPCIEPPVLGPLSRTLVSGSSVIHYSLYLITVVAVDDSDPDP